MSIRRSPDFEPAARISWRAPSSATTARPSVPLAPITRIRNRRSVAMTAILRPSRPPASALAMG
jgi:hypothetical protein